MSTSAASVEELEELVCALPRLLHARVHFADLSDFVRTRSRSRLPAPSTHSCQLALLSSNVDLRLTATVDKRKWQLLQQEGEGRTDGPMEDCKEIITAAASVSLHTVR